MTDTPTLLAVCPSGDLPEGGSARTATEGGRPIAVFRSEGTLYAVDDTCTHGQASLADGWLEGGEIECPVHQGRFCLKTGRPLCFPVTEPIRTYGVTERDGLVYVELGPSGD